MSGPSEQRQTSEQRQLSEQRQPGPVEVDGHLHPPDNTRATHGRSATYPPVPYPMSRAADTALPTYSESIAPELRRPSASNPAGEGARAPRPPPSNPFSNANAFQYWECPACKTRKFADPERVRNLREHREYIFECEAPQCGVMLVARVKKNEPVAVELYVAPETKPKRKRKWLKKKGKAALGSTKRFLQGGWNWLTAIKPGLYEAGGVGRL